MFRAVRRVLAVVVALALQSAAGGAADKLMVVATLPDLGFLTEAVGGDLVEVAALVRGSQNPHDLEVRPSLMVKVRRADAVVINGLDLDRWVESVVLGANNARVIPGAPGRIDASRGIPVLEVPTGRLDRSMGDVHPAGNPHYTVDPGLAPIITRTIAEGLGRLAPQHRERFARNRQEFLDRLDQAMGRWTRALEPHKGARVVSYHNDYLYLLTRFGLVQVGTVEDRPGIPPSPGHLVQLARLMKDDRVKAVIAEPWVDQKLAARVAQEAGARSMMLPPTAGAVKGARSYIEGMDTIVETLARALQ